MRKQFLILFLMSCYTLPSQSSHVDLTQIDIAKIGSQIKSLYDKINDFALKDDTLGREKTSIKISTYNLTSKINSVITKTPIHQLEAWLFPLKKLHESTCANKNISDKVVTKIYTTYQSILDTVIQYNALKSVISQFNTPFTRNMCFGCLHNPKLTVDKSIKAGNLNAVESKFTLPQQLALFFAKKNERTAIEFKIWRHNSYRKIKQTFVKNKITPLRRDERSLNYSPDQSLPVVTKYDNSYEERDGRSPEWPESPRHSTRLPPWLFDVVEIGINQGPNSSFLSRYSNSSLQPEVENDLTPISSPSTEDDPEGNAGW